MNHNDSNSAVPDFYNLAQQERANQEEDPWAGLSRTSKKKKKKARNYASVEEVPFATVEDDIHVLPAVEPELPAAVAENENQVLGLAYGDFVPEQLPLDDVDVEQSSLPRRSFYDKAPAFEKEHIPYLHALPLREPAESPRFAFSTPATHATSPSTRNAVPYGSPNSNIQANSNERPTSRTIRTTSKRESFPAPSSPDQRFIEPKAPPHMAQPHFYGLPNLGLDLGLTKQQSAGKTAGSDGYCCFFDSLADCGDATSARKAKDALLVGSEGGLEVFRVLSNKVEVVGRLDGLRGSVIGAKILPHVGLYDGLQSMRPLVAVVVHGVVEEVIGSPVRSPTAMGSLLYQTSVEIYSLKTQQHLTTLYRSSPTTVPTRSRDDSTSGPGSVEDLSVVAQGKFVIVASGKSGEVFVFSNTATRSEPEYRCIGKFWTSLQVPLEKAPSRPPSAGGSHATTEEHHGRASMPLFSLSQRWLAIVPPSTSSHVSIQGSPLLSDSNPSPPGLASAVAPPQAPITCEVTGVDTEDAWSRLTRQAAQGVVKYSQKGIDLGWQGWKELTNPTPQAMPQNNNREREGLFPPTKAPPDDPLRLSQEPAVVCIMDLEALLEAEATRAKYPPAPLATFALPDGCNFLSFSTSGLRLLAVSRKGETSTIWDLTQSCHGKGKHQESEGQHALTEGPRIKQIHRIPRSSPALVVECAWSRNDDSIAILTAHGTVHLHEILIHPSRKRRRRPTETSPSAQKAEATVSISQGNSPPSSNGGLLGSIKSGWQQMSTFRAASSSFGIPSFTGFKEATTSVGSIGGRVLARGLSQGLSAAKGGASDYWHADDNKIRHKALQAAGPRALMWIRRQSDLFLAVVCQGVVHLHPVQRTHRRKGDDLVSGLKHDKYGQKHFELPSIRTRASLEVEGDVAAAKHGLRGFWKLRSSTTTDPSEVTNLRPIPPPSAHPNEVETNPPYCPFHIDSRVDIFVFESEGIDNDIGQPSFFDVSSHRTTGFHTLGHGQRKAPSWLFGEPLPPSTKMNTHDDLEFLRRGARGDEFESESEAELEGQVRSFLTIAPGDEDRDSEMDSGGNAERSGLVGDFESVDDL